jgi:transcriptional regulator with XRE-family HTH domain
MWGTGNLNFGKQKGMGHPDPITFGTTLRELREARGLSQEELGDMSGYSQQRIGSLEKGKVRRPDRAAAALADALGSTRKYLLYREGPRFVGPFFLTTKQVVEKYEALEPPGKERVSKVLLKEQEMVDLA